MTDFSRDDILIAWFRDNIWLSNPKQWSLERLRRVEAESFQVRRELQRRLQKVRSSKWDTGVFWSGVAMSVAGVVLLAVPPAAVLAAVGAPLAYAGLGASFVGGAVRHVNAETADQLEQRSAELTDLQRAIADIKNS